LLNTKGEITKGELRITKGELRKGELRKGELRKRITKENYEIGITTYEKGIFNVE
jgi:hypothetical protein